MIYLIDDKKLRQERNYNWSEHKFLQYNQLITPIYDLERLKLLKDELYKDNNTVIYHESFLDTTKFYKDSLKERTKLVNYANNNTKFKLVLFSGGMNTRSIKDNLAYLPASNVYQNLSLFIIKYSEDDSDLRYLAYGLNKDIEKELIEEQDQALKNTIKNKKAIVIEGQKNLFLPTFEKFIENPIENATIIDFFDVEKDSDISEFILKLKNSDEFDNIFIPLCYGNSLSDFNGLRLASHIRSTPSPIQLSKIFIYGFVGMDYLLNNPYFNILKTKNVFLTGYEKSNFRDSAIKKQNQLTFDELPNEIKKLNLELPDNYEDDHFLSNEWAIYRWSHSLGIDKNDASFQSITNKVNENLYFKYLKTINPILFTDILSESELLIENRYGAKVLFIDDEIDKGWNELLAYLLTDINKIYSDCLGNNFKSLTSDEIIELSMKKIKEDEIDIVILDFRLSLDDYKPNNLNEITSIKLLRKIKNYNPGIQVIALSATNKIWNLQELQRAGVDGFVVKESPYNSREKEFTRKSILSLIYLLNRSTERVFLIDLFIILNNIKFKIKSIEYENDSPYHNLIKELLAQLKIISETARNIDLDHGSSIDIVFLSCFKFLELFKNEYYFKQQNYSFVLGNEEVEMNWYYFKDGKIHNNGNREEKPSWFSAISSLMIDFFKICNFDDPLILNLNTIRIERNNYIHNKKSHISVEGLKMIFELMFVISENMKE